MSWSSREIESSSDKVGASSFNRNEDCKNWSRLEIVGIVEETVVVVVVLEEEEDFWRRAWEIWRRNS